MADGNEWKLRQLPEEGTPRESTAPAYYTMPDGTQVKKISRHLTGNGAQAVQYVARSCRVDGVIKGEGVEDQLRDLGKAVDFIQDEIARLKELARLNG